MIIARSPLRISLGGGGTDLPSYYRKHGGFLIAGAIDKFVYITLHKTFKDCLIVKYSEMENVSQAKNLKHPIIRECFRLMGLDGKNLELASLADIPSGTGLGSSGSFTTALLKALHALNSKHVSQSELAEMACNIELNILNEPIGKQDQYISAVGGITCFRFNPDDTVTMEPLRISDNTLYELEDNLIMFFTGYSRKASSILKEQDNKSKSANQDMIDNLHYVKELGLRSKDALEGGDLLQFGKIFHEHWQHKKKRSPSMTNRDIDKWYEIAMNNQAIGGKLIGAGGGGFLLFLTENKKRLRNAMREQGLKEVRIRFASEGAKIIVD